ncbi:MAG: glycosyl transferase family 2 [Proteobacteria bacterium]|nr:MAG: glycosyl transferase family 2 [Pseudomonadota bacterium]
MAQVQVLLSTWNGERWLGELLDSLLQQSFQDWTLLVRDDGSSDQTCQLLVAWQRRWPQKLVLLETAYEHLGSTASFSRLVELSQAPYLMFCDQDDVWFPEKMASLLAEMQRLEQVYGTDLPLLVHADMAVVDEQRRVLNASFWQSRSFNVTQPQHAYLLDNIVSGCAALFNRVAAQMAFPAPPEAIQHDRWLALICAWWGKVGVLAEPLMFYRQHDHNEIGAASVNWCRPALAQRVERWSQQAEAFLRQFAAHLDKADYKKVQALAELRHLHGWQRRRHILRHRLFKQKVMANWVLLLFA